MTYEETRKILKEVKMNYLQSFSKMPVSDMQEMLDYWYEKLKGYQFEDVMRATQLAINNSPYSFPKVKQVIQEIKINPPMKSSNRVEKLNALRRQLGLPEVWPNKR